jgi:hypothetical protein
MKPKYKQVVLPHFMANPELNNHTKDYNLKAVFNSGKEGIVYIFKRKSFIARLINKVINK